MKIYNLVFFTLFISIFFSACSEKTNAMRYFDEDSKQGLTSIQYTKKVDLSLDGQNEAAIIVSYLNKIDKKYKSKDNDTFLVAIQIFNNINLFKDRFEILLNDNLPVSYEKIDNDSELIKKISLKNHWAKYYLVRFKVEDNKDKSLALTVSHNRLGEKSIMFEK